MTEEEILDTNDSLEDQLDTLLIASRGALDMVEERDSWESMDSALASARAYLEGAAQKLRAILKNCEQLPPLGGVSKKSKNIAPAQPRT